jgi:hypothetical protein
MKGSRNNIDTLDTLVANPVDAIYTNGLLSDESRIAAAHTAAARQPAISCAPA